jgi:hypothetical protein
MFTLQSIICQVGGSFLTGKTLGNASPVFTIDNRLTVLTKNPSSLSLTSSSPDTGKLDIDDEDEE